ncbi:MAG: hypothetical protein ABEI98_05840 [Halorhabdus sp.]
MILGEGLNATFGAGAVVARGIAYAGTFLFILGFLFHIHLYSHQHG